MKIRTVENLYDAISLEISWRKKELSDFRALIERSGLSESKKHALLRGGVALLYAHWEGFIKAAAVSYLEFVSRQRLRHNELAINFVAICMKKYMAETALSDKTATHIKTVDFMLSTLNSRSDMPYKNVINTKANLNSEVFENLLTQLGFNDSYYKTKQKLIDEKLLASRNSIAHGAFLPIEESEYIEMYEKILEMMEYFRNQIDNSAALKTYRRV